MFLSFPFASSFLSANASCSTSATSSTPTAWASVLSPVIYVAAKSAGCSLELMHLSKQVRHLLGITHMLEVFTVIGESGVKFM